MATEQELTIGYRAIRGLVAPLRMMTMYSNTPFRCELYECREINGDFDRSMWLEKSKPALKEMNPLMNLPYLIDNDGTIVAQSNACFLYLGRKFGMLGSSQKELSFCEQLLCEILDLRNQMVGYAYSSRGSNKEETEKFFNNASGIFDKLELVFVRKISNGDTSPFLVGSKVSAPDFHLWEMLDHFDRVSKYHNLVSPFSLTTFPLLQKFHIEFANLPGNSKYMKSSLAIILPMNNPSAKVGAVPEGGAWIPGQEFTWSGLSGMY